MFFFLLFDCMLMKTKRPRILFKKTEAPIQHSADLFDLRRCISLRSAYLQHAAIA